MRIKISLLTFICILQTLFSAVYPENYTINSVLSENRFYKIRVAQSGVYKLTFEQLLSMGIDPANVRIFGYGGAVLNRDLAKISQDDLPEIAIWLEKGDDDIFNAGDYILFYAQGAISWSYDKNRSMFTHTNNTYSNYGYYFVSSSDGGGKRIQTRNIQLPNNVTPNVISEFNDYQVHERDVISLIRSGKEFYGEVFKEITNYSFDFNFPNIVRSENTVIARCEVVANSAKTSTFTLSLDANQDKTINVNAVSFGDPYERGKATNATLSYTPHNDACRFNLSYASQNNFSVGYLNYLEVNARRRLIFAGDVMEFRDVDYLGTETWGRYEMNCTNPNVVIWDITNHSDIEQIEVNSNAGIISFTDSCKSLKNYLAINPKNASAFSSPEIMESVPTQNLHAINQADMVIITHPDFLEQAERLAEVHRTKDQFIVAVVTTDQVYNEFSSGTPDATAYRRFIRMLYDRALANNKPDEKPKYLLLFGKGSFDNRKILSDSGDNLLLTYQADNSLSETWSYVTDDYFSYLENGEGVNNGSYTMDIAVGRFPVTTVQQAADVVNKTINYINNADYGSWKNELSFVSDDGESNVFMNMTDLLAKTISTDFPLYHANKLYLDVFPQTNINYPPTCPAATEKLISSINSGMFYINYTGHGFEGGWAHENLLSTTDIANLRNQYLPLWISASCDFMKFDGKVISAGEQVILNPVGGGIGILAAARPVYASQNFSLNKVLLQSLFTPENGNYLRVGDVILKSKNSIPPEINKLSFIYIGDPAVRLNYGDEYIVETQQINGSDISESDTLKTNSTNIIQGSITDGNNRKIDNFNGSLYLSVYDKEQSIVTLGDELYNEAPFKYNDRPMLIQSEAIPVISGDFSYSFLLPDNQSDEYGIGKIIYYAKDEANKYEAKGFLSDFTIGKKLTASLHQFPLEDDYQLSNFPNPAQYQTCFKMEGQSDIISFNVDIFDISGKLIRSLNSIAGNKIYWDLTTTSGAKSAPGVYYYYAKIKTTSGMMRSRANKLIIN